MSPVEETASGNSNPGRKMSFTRRARTDSTISGSCAQSEMACRLLLRESTIVSAVPQLPAPIIAILFIE